MSKRSDLLMGCLLGNRWNATHAPAAGTTIAVQSPATADANSRPNLEFLWYSIRNETGVGAIPFTVSVQVRHASQAGTLIASVEHLSAPSSTANVSVSEMGIAGKRGGRIFIGMNTVVASLTQSVNAAGWIEDTNG